MKALNYWCFLLALGLSFCSYADHVAGGFFVYTYQGNNVYQIDYYFLRDCGGAQVNDSPHLYMQSICGHTCTDLGEMDQIGNEETVDYGCGNQCPQNIGYKMFHFQKNVTLNSVCAEWTFSTSIDNRNIVDYIIEGDNWPYYNYCKINNTVSNSSPDISGHPIVVGCVTWESEPLYSVTPTGGDAIVFDLIPSQVSENYIGGNGPCTSHDVVYENTLSATQTFPSTAPFALDQVYGTFTFVPTTIGSSYFALRAREYRNGVWIGETVIDGMVLVKACASAGEVTFESFPLSGTNVMSVPDNPGTYCETVTLTSDEIIEEVTVNAPDFVEWSVTSVSTHEAAVTICVNTTGLEYSCAARTFNFVINALSGESDDCLANVNGFPDRGYYSIYKQPGEYCPENLFFTNRNPQSGIPMPLGATAEERIWIGDNMPSIAPPQPEGAVFINGNAEYTAGIEIILPSCDQGTGCVTMTGNLTLRIAPNTCSSNCPQEEFAVNVREYFKCGEEKMEVEADGTAPFTYQLILLGDTITQNSSGFSIHDIVASQDNGQIPYVMNVYDAAGNFGTFNGNVLGTKRFYEPIINNKHYFHYPENSPWGETGYYYDANLWIFSDTPAYWTDSTNTTPPWYGATDMWLTIWASNGSVVNDIRHNLELQDDGTGGEDWSLNQGEFWWNGKEFNGIWADCYEGQNTDIFQYILKARNCYNDETMTPPTLFPPTDLIPGIDEEASVLIWSCTDDDPWHPVEEKSTSTTGDDNNDYAEYQRYTGHTRGRDFIIENTNEAIVSLVPNPANDWVQLTGNFVKVTDLVIVDASGKTVLKKAVVAKDERIDVSSLASGVYTVHCTTTEGTLQYKLTIL